MKDIYEVFPFGNEVCVIEATGQQILDANGDLEKFAGKPFEGEWTYNAKC